MQKQKSNSMSGKFGRLMAIALKFILLNLIRANIIILTYLFRFTLFISERSIHGLSRIAPHVDIHLSNKKVATSIGLMEKTFTDDQIDQMAKRLPDHVDTIQGIADHYSISTRQARKVRHSIENTINVNTYQPA